jgi:hypothetical protein
VGNTLVPALLLLAAPLALLAVQLGLFRHAVVRHGGAVLLIGLVVLEFPEEGFDEAQLNHFKMVLAAGLALMFFLRHAGMLRSWSHMAWIGCLAGTAVASITLYTDFFCFHGTSGFAHWHEVTHYYLGSKYFPELGYQNLYVALLRAEEEDAGTIPSDRIARDLMTNRLVPAEELLPKSDPVKARFSPERWQGFRRDSALFRSIIGPALLVDHGYNPTPVWTLVGGALANLVPAGDRGSVICLTLLDPILLTTAALAVAWGFGLETALIAICYFGLIFGTSFGWTGGAYLRVMWFASTVGAVACLHRGRHATAGALMAFAALVRVFPMLFAVPLFLQAIGQLWRVRRIAPQTKRFLVGFTLSAVVFIGASVLVPPNAYAWREFARNSHVYMDNLGRNLVGLTAVATLLIGRFTTSGEQVSEQLFAMHRHIQQIQVFVLMPLAIAGVAAVANRVDDAKAATLGVFLVFVGLNPACYYFTFLILLILSSPDRMDRLALIFSVEFITYLLTLFEAQDSSVLYLYRSALVFWMLVSLAVDEIRLIFPGSAGAEVCEPSRPSAEPVAPDVR